MLSVHEHIMNDLDQFNFIISESLPITSNHTVKLTVSGLSAVYRPPDGLDLVAFERKCQFIQMLGPQTCKRHGQVVPEPFFLQFFSVSW